MATEDEERTKAIVQDVLQGSTLAEVAIRYGISRQRVGAIFKSQPTRRSEEVGIVLTRAKRLAERNLRIRNLIRTGSTSAEIGNTFGLSESTVRAISGGLFTEIKVEREAAFIAARMRGLTAKQIAAEFDVPKSLVFRVLSDHGITAKKNNLIKRSGTNGDPRKGLPRPLHGHRRGGVGGEPDVDRQSCEGSLESGVEPGVQAGPALDVEERDAG